MADRLSESPETAEDAFWRVWDNAPANTSDDEDAYAALSAALEVERRKLRAVVEAVPHNMVGSDGRCYRELCLGCKVEKLARVEEAPRA